MRAIVGTSVEEAVRWLRQGEPVALPTETVYGLAAPLSKESAIRKIYAYKQRPAHNPLIVHVLGVESLQAIAEVTPLVQRLAERFWPGPLTFVLKKKPSVPDIVTAGQSSVAVRCPRSPIFRDVLTAIQEPLVAPSANRFQQVSPTTAAHVRNNMGDVLSYILDGGACPLGLESTIVLLLDECRPTLLRDGPVSWEVLQDFLKIPVGRSNAVVAEKMPHLAPGLYKRHYSPKTPLYWVDCLSTFVPASDEERKIFQEQSVHVFLFPPLRSLQPYERVLSPRGNLEEAAANLFACLQALDEEHWRSIWIESAPQQGIGRAINDRLSRAAYVDLRKNHCP